MANIYVWRKTPLKTRQNPPAAYTRSFWSFLFLILNLGFTFILASWFFKYLLINVVCSTPRSESKQLGGVLACGDACELDPATTTSSSIEGGVVFLLLFFSSRAFSSPYLRCSTNLFLFGILQKQQNADERRMTRWHILPQ